MVRDVRERRAILGVHALQFFERGLEVVELDRMLPTVRLELSQVTAVELDEVAAPEPFPYKDEVHGAHREEREQGETRAEVERGEPVGGAVAGVEALHDVRLALGRPPFVLPSELGCAHVVKQEDEAGHKFFFGEVLAGMPGLTRALLAAAEQLVVDLEVPVAPLDPFVDFAVAAKLVVEESGIHVADGVFVAEPQLRAATDQLLPERSGTCRGPVDLGGERALVP